MSAYKQVFVVLAGLVGLAFLVSFVLPSSWEVSREMQIGVWPREVHVVAGDLDTWSQWSVWSKEIDPDATVKASRQSEGVGATLEWSGPELGKGSLKITASDREKGIWFDVLLRDGREPVQGTLQYIELPTGATMARLTLRGDVSGNPIGRYIGLARGYTLGPDIVEALSRLKRTVEMRM